MIRRFLIGFFETDLICGQLFAFLQWPLASCSERLRPRRRSEQDAKGHCKKAKSCPHIRSVSKKPIRNLRIICRSYQQGVESYTHFLSASICRSHRPRERRKRRPTQRRSSIPAGRPLRKRTDEAASYNTRPKPRGKYAPNK